MLENSLKKLGLKEKEIKVFGLVISHRGATPPEIARLTNLNRTTVYALMKSLVSKGLIKELVGRKSKTFVPASPDDLKQTVKNQEKEIEQKQKAVKELVGQLSLAGISSEYEVPSIRFIEEQDLDDYLYKRNRIWNNSAITKDKIWWGFQDHTYAEKYKDWIDWFWKTAPDGMSVKLLSNESQIEGRLRGKHARREIKFWRGQDNFTATTWVIGNFLVMVNTRIHPFSLIEIQDELISHNMRELFKKVWHNYL